VKGLAYARVRSALPRRVATNKRYKEMDKAIRQWEGTLIDAYYDHYYHQILDPLYEQFQRWKIGELTHEDMNEAIHKVHKENQRLYSFFTRSRKDLVWMIQRDREWFTSWVVDHPPPPGVQLAQWDDWPDVIEYEKGE
jgi:hypothetical protein